MNRKFFKALVCLSALSFILCGVYAAECGYVTENGSVISSDINLDNEVVVTDEDMDDDSDDRTPYSSTQVISGESLTQSGSYWNQPSNYSYYRVYVKNNGNKKLNVTISYGNGKTHTFSVAANDSYTLNVSNANSGSHVISYSTSSGSLNGSVSVRVSDTAF